MRRRFFVGGLVVVLAILIGWWLLSARKVAKPEMAENPSPAPSATPFRNVTGTTPSAVPVIAPPALPFEERQKIVVGKVLGMLSTPIAFYGKVVDQNSDPVSGALINYGALDRYDDSGGQYQGKSDVNGNFSISGIMGAVLRVGVQKEGYYMVDGKSAGAFAYGMEPDSNSKSPPTPENPAIFVLRKGGTKEPLIYVSSLQIDVPKSGQPFLVDLATGQKAQGNLQVESEIGDISKKPYKWRYRLSIPGGGIIERTSDFDFEAPTEGFKSAIEIGMDTTTERWSSDVSKSFFAKLSDGRYARFSVNFYPGDRNFIVLESYVNPKTGSRNLEFDPNKQVTPP